MERKKVYNLIDGERDYQDQKWRENATDNSISDWLTYIRIHLLRADEAVYNGDKDEVMSQIRKIAALAVASIEEHSAPKRELSTL